MRKKHFFSRLLALSMALLLLPACAANTDMTITDQNGKEIEVSSAGNDTYTFKVPTSKPLANGWDNPFIDVTEGAWYYDAVRYCYENSLMRGTTENTFSPNAPTSRAMIVAILWRLEGSPSAGRNTFRDVPENQYYADAVAWAASQESSAASAMKFSPPAMPSPENRWRPFCIAMLPIKTGIFSIPRHWMPLPMPIPPLAMQKMPFPGQPPTISSAARRIDC